MFSVVKYTCPINFVTLLNQPILIGGPLHCVVQVLSQYYVQYTGSFGGHGITWCEDINLFKYLCNIWRAQSNAYYRGNYPSKHLFNNLIVELPK